MDGFDTKNVPNGFLALMELAQALVRQRIAVVGLLSNDGSALELVFNPALSDADVATVCLSLSQHASKSR